jgi:uncharacterized membrane protein
MNIGEKTAGWNNSRFKCRIARPSRNKTFRRRVMWLKMENQTDLKCPVCGKAEPLGEMVPAKAVRPSIAALIRERNPDWPEDGFICRDDLDGFRADYVVNVIKAEKGALTELENEVVKSLKEQELLAKNVNDEFEGKLTFGERIADKVATFGGSWRFIITFGVIIVCWITLNSIMLLRKPFDPFPFILLNLLLSCLAALQAPVIMMSQNRQESKDRLRSQNDYRINLKSELEIRHLNEKIDFLLTNQWQRLLEIQQIQIELMREHLKSETKE